MQFKAGYIVDSIAKVVADFKAKLDRHKPTDQNQLDQINGLLQYASSFDVDFYYKYAPDFKKLNPVLATLNNIITRGLPTRAPLILENLFAEIGLTEQSKEEFEINFPKLITPISYESIFELLHIIEPQLDITKANYGGNLGSSLEWEFIKKHPFVKQILESQRDFSTINSKLAGGKSVDFCFTSPYLHWNENNNRYEKVGRIFEVDGSHHSLSEYKYYDAYRDTIAEDENFETIRFTVETIKADNTDFEALIGRKIYQNFKNNFEKNIKEHLAEYSLIFIPFAVARVQKTVLEFLLVHPELFNKERIEIAIIERDLPCGAIAIKSLEELFFNINAILDDKDKLLLPEISLTVFENSKWVIDKKLHLQKRVEDESFFKKNEFDIVIDHSILRRSNIYKEADFLSDKAIKIRSSHFFDTAFGKMRRVYCADLLHYKALVEKKDDGSYIPVSKYEYHINFFIQSIFRKVSFREGQLPIISRALQQKPVIGLLPTGGGKSLTFQLPTFLQPGLCLVVDPIKSLMEDQVRVLKQNWIDCCEFINSNLKREERVKKLIDFRYGETMFLFVSPERFVMQDFRNIIRTIDVSKFGLAFSYCVIDEVHCVSEWGHDFRSTYLMLGKNAQRFAKTKTAKAVSLIGLTATASFLCFRNERKKMFFCEELKNKIIHENYRIGKEDAFRLKEEPLEILANAANDLRIHFCGNDFDLCTIINAKSGRCSENCRYCAQSVHYKTESPTYSLLGEDVILEEAKRQEKRGVPRFSLVTSGRTLSAEDLEKICEDIKKIKKETSLSVCLSSGLLTEEQFLKLKKAGLSRVHNNLETSRHNFSEVCTTHSYDDKMECLRAAARVGLSLCSGGIMGLGESFEDRIDMLMDIRDLNITSIPVNVLNAIPGTPYGELPKLTDDEVCQMVSIYRFIIPAAFIRLAGGRGLLSDKGRRAFQSGANAAISGDMLTTAGISVETDLILIKELGYTIRKVN